MSHLNVTWIVSELVTPGCEGGWGWLMSRILVTEAGGCSPGARAASASPEAGGGGWPLTMHPAHQLSTDAFSYLFSLLYNIKLKNCIYSNHLIRQNQTVSIDIFFTWLISSAHFSALSVCEVQFSEFLIKFIPCRLVPAQTRPSGDGRKGISNIKWIPSFTFISVMQFSLSLDIECI